MTTKTFDAVKLMRELRGCTASEEEVAVSAGRLREVLRT
jgi:hypothetical protein